MKTYLRIIGESFEFRYGDMDDILDIDIPITQEDFELFFNEQAKGKQYKIRASPDLSMGFMGYFEEFKSEPLSMTLNKDVTISDLMSVIVDLTERLNEKGLL